MSVNAKEGNHAEEDVGRFVEGVKDHDWKTSAALKLQSGASLAKEGETYVYTLDEGAATARRYVIRFRRPPAGPVMIFEPDPPSEMSAPASDAFLKAVDRRLNSGPEELARVRKLDDGRFEVALLRRNDADRQRVERLLGRPGRLEFRILASNHQDKTLIEQARKDPSKAKVLDPAGKKLAWWVPVKAGAEEALESDADIVRRTTKQGQRDVTEVLVVTDSCNVTGAYITEAKAVTDRDHTDLNFTLNAAGGKLFSKLTGDHVPDSSSDFRYRLGIIPDGELFSAPMLQAPISGKGTITGNFTKEQASDLADVLNSGSLPCRLRLVPAAPKGPTRTPAEPKP